MVFSALPPFCHAATNAGAKNITFSCWKGKWMVVTFGAANNGKAGQATGFAGCSPDLFTSKSDCKCDGKKF